MQDAYRGRLARAARTDATQSERSARAAFSDPNICDVFARFRARRDDRVGNRSF